MTPIETCSGYSWGLRFIRRLLAAAGLLVVCIPVAVAQYRPITEIGRSADVIAFATVDRVLNADGPIQLQITQVIKGTPSLPTVSVSIESKCGPMGGRMRLCVHLTADDVGKSGIWFLKSADNGYAVIPRNSAAHDSDELFLPFHGTPRPTPTPQTLDEALLGYLVEWFQGGSSLGFRADEALFSGLSRWSLGVPTSQQIVDAIAPLIQSPYPSQHAVGLIIALREDSPDAMTQVLDELPVLQSNPRFHEIVFAIGAYPTDKKDPRWIAPLRRLLNLHADIPGLDVAAAGALYRIGTRETIPMVAELLDSKDPGAQMIAGRTLAIRVSFADANGRLADSGPAGAFTTSATRAHTPGWPGPKLTDEEFVRFWKTWWVENHDKLGMPLVDPLAKRETPLVLERPLPYINRDGIVRVDTSRVGILSPGIAVSIYGHGFGPAAGCTGPAMELCGVKVLLDGEPMEILHVSDVQVNVRIPAVPPVQATGRIAVIAGNRTSDPAEVRRLP